jgi:hypothetical protein
VAQIVTDKLEESFGEDQEQSGAENAAASQPQVSQLIHEFITLKDML